MKKLLWSVIAVLCVGILPTETAHAAKANAEVTAGAEVKANVEVAANAEAAAKDEVTVTQINQLMTAGEDFDMKETPDENADVIHSFKSGEPVLVSGETQDGWYQIVFQGKKGYAIKTSVIISDVIDVGQLDQEMEQNQVESKILVEETERHREDVKQSRIWGSVIVLLVIGIFATGIISALKNKNDDRQENEEIAMADHPQMEGHIRNSVEDYEEDEIREIEEG